MAKTAILLGATGLIGNEVLQILLADPDFGKIKIFVRKSIRIEHPKLEQHIIDFNFIENYSELIDGEVIFCCIGTTIKTAGSKEAFIKVDYTYPLAFAAIAKRKGVEKFLLISSLGTDKMSSNFYLKVKGDIENGLEELNFKSLIILRPSMLLGDRKEFRFGEALGKIVMKLFSFVFIGKLKKYKAIEASIVAKAMVRFSKSEYTGVHIFESDRLEQAIKD